MQTTDQSNTMSNITTYDFVAQKMQNLNFFLKKHVPQKQELLKFHAELITMSALPPEQILVLAQEAMLKPGQTKKPADFVDEILRNHKVNGEPEVQKIKDVFVIYMSLLYDIAQTLTQ